MTGAKLNLLDLFSGIGGFSLGLERTGGFQTVAFSEIEDFPSKILNKHWPEVPNYGDIRELTAARLRDDGISVDAICGGFPCQDISEAGLRKGLEGERSGLWSEYWRLIGEIGPKVVFVENVSDLRRRGLGKVLRDLASIGYDAEWHSIPALAVGADHIRERVWIIAYPNGSRPEVIGISGRKQCPEEVGKNAAQDYAHSDGARLARGMHTRALSQDAREVSSWLGFALCSPPAFPRLDGAGSPVMGRGENGVPNRVDRCHALGNAVVPQIPELLGNAYLQSIGWRDAA